MKIKAEAEEVKALLIKNGGPLAKRAAVLISKLEKYIPNEEPGALHPLRLKIIQIRTKAPRAARPEKENRDWAKLGKLITAADVDLLVKFYKLPQSRLPDETWNRKVSVAQIFSQCLEQIELAETYKSKHPHLFASTKKDPHLAEPNGWQAHAPGNLGDRSWTLVCQQYPDIAKEIAESINSS